MFLSSSPKKFLSSPRNTKKKDYIKIIKEDSKEEQSDKNEIADAIIGILEEIALSNEPYKPSKRILSHSRSSRIRRISSHSHNPKRRRMSTTKQIFPRTPRSERKRKMSKSSNKSSSKTTAISDVSILNILGGDLRNLDKV